LAQTHPAVEAIVVDDGSDDDTPQVGASYGDRICYIRQENKGPAAARNTGIAIARGKYIKFLDADDYLAPQQVEWQVDTLERSRPNSISMTALRNFQEDAPDKCWDHVPDFQRMLPDIFKEHDGCAPHCMLLPIELVKSIGGFAEHIRHVEDWEIGVRLGRREPEIHVDPRIGGYYRRRAGSISTQRTAWLKSLSKCLMTVHDELRETNRRDWYGPELLAYERAVLRGMLVDSIDEPELITGLFARVEQLRRDCTPFDEGRWLRRLTRVVGYQSAERLACVYRRCRQLAART
jgi:glycosyltransferase involved in cell wall biosynthesis